MDASDMNHGGAYVPDDDVYTPSRGQAQPQAPAAAGALARARAIVAAVMAQYDRAPLNVVRRVELEGMIALALNEVRNARDEELDQLRAELADTRAALGEVHARLDAAGIPSAQGVACSDPTCNTKAGHRVKVAIDELQELREVVGRRRSGGGGDYDHERHSETLRGLHGPG